MSEFESLKAKLVSEGRLWEDEEFPAAPESLAVAERRSPYIRWLRPAVSDLTFIRDDFSFCHPRSEVILFSVVPVCPSIR